MQDKPAALRLLKEADLNSPLVGWQSTALGSGGLVNMKFGVAMLRVIFRKFTEGHFKDLYDQPFFVENPGSIVACQLGDRIGLVQNFRLVGERLITAGSDYVQRLEKEGRWEELLNSLGAWKWELPRGLSPTAEGKDLEQFVLATAKAEAFEESGLEIAESRVIGRINVNSTFFAHSQYVVHGRIVARGKNRPESTEVLGKTKLFSPAELARMSRSGELDDGFTLGAIGLMSLQGLQGSSRTRDGRGFDDDDRQLIDCVACKGSGNLLDVSGNPVTDGRKVPYPCQTCNRAGKVRA